MGKRLQHWIGVGIVSLLAAALLAGCGRPTPVPPVAPGLLDAGAVGVTGSQPATKAPVPPTVAPAPTKVVAPVDKLKLAPQMGISVFASGLDGVRSLALAPSGDLFAALPRFNRIVVLPDDNADGVADRSVVFAEGPGLNQPSGLAFVEGSLVVANTDGLIRYDYAVGDRRAAAPSHAILALPGGGQAPYRPVALRTDGRLVVGVGASCTACEETDERRASLLAVPIDGASAPVRLASGLHAPAGIAVDRASEREWFSEVSRDGLGEQLPPDEINVLEPGDDYGWPRCFGAQVPDLTTALDISTCTHTVPPAVSLPAHVTPAGLTFTDGANLAPEYAHGLLVALEGSTTRQQPVGYAVVFLPFADGTPTGEVKDFISGWLRSDQTRWGRPTDVTIGADGSVYVADEGAGIVYRAFYLGRYATPTPPFRER